MRTYGQFCTVARSLDLLGERWTLLIVREALCGSTRFEEIRRGVPRISRTMLSDRLTRLVEHGVLERRPRDDGAGHAYHLTPAGQELGPLIAMLGTWGRRWLDPRLAPQQLDPDFLLWDIRRGIRRDALPDERVTVRFDFHDRPPDARVYYLQLHPEDVALCATNPGFDVGLDVHTDVDTLSRFWLGDLSYADALRAGSLRIDGPRHLVRQFPDWFSGYAFADVEPQRAASA